MVNNPAASIANAPDQHGFIMTGTETVFLNHLAMFHMRDHRYQLILRISLPDYAMSRYVADQQENPNTTYVLGNVQFDLMTIPQIQNGELNSFVADIFRGLPQDPNKDAPWIHNVRTTIERVVYYRHFDFSMAYPTSLTYLVYGAGTEAHMAHYMTKQPDFQHILSLVELPDWVPPQQLEAAFHINVPGLPNNPLNAPTYCANPFTTDKYRVNFQGQEDLYPIQIGRTIYFDTGSLNSPDPCGN